MHVILLEEHLGQRPVAQGLDVPELATPVEVSVGATTPGDQILWHGSQEFDEECQVVLISWVFVGGLGVKKVVTGCELKNHAGQ